MVESAFKTIAPEVGAPRMLADLDEVRARTHRLVEHLDADELERTHSPIMSPLVWDLAHIASYEDLWLAHRHAGAPLVRPDLAALYDAFETPRAVRGDLELLDTQAAWIYMEEVRDRVRSLTLEQGVGDGTLHEMVVRHELQHTETMLQTMSLAGLMPPDLPNQPSLTAAQLTGPQWVEVQAATFEMGADPNGFAYDNERQRHAVSLPAFRISRLPVSNAQWREFRDQGGYERSEWWSDAGWAWLQGIESPCDPRAGAGEDHAPVCHLSFHEAQALTRCQGARLPSEAEWERAAGIDALAGVGEVWEWTGSEFAAYPGFAAHPYREYSEVFFEKGYRVLRGGSFAAHPRVATRTFRNWDLPERRQIFAGLRLANDL
ncbi:MAG: SUMF1/EgtB/PvdO family nonheme iron enzyme [Solirubrobacteraceae bacterium]